MNTLPLTEGVLQRKLGKIRVRDERIAQFLTWVPWLAVVLVSIPLPIVFLMLFMTSAATDSAAVYLLLSFVSLGLGLVVGLVLVILLLLYRRHWYQKLRDRLAADGITASEVSWFTSELSSAERGTWQELQRKNPLLADAYCETLAGRLTATRITKRTRAELLRIERQINLSRSLKGVDTSELLNDLNADRQRLDNLRQEAVIRLSTARARLQTIEAAANRALSQSETDLMLQRLASSQEQSPLALEIAKLEQDVLLELEPPRSKDSS
ncbi:MAG: hypothetical protein AABN95_21315 [Acidobacteriota bacterium]